MNNTEKKKPFDLDLLSIPELTDVSDKMFNESENLESMGSKYVIFLIEGVHYAIDSSQVSEVVRMMSFTTLPNVPGWFAGISNLRGDILSIIDLNVFWNKKHQDSPKSKLIVLRQQDADSNIAFRVEKLREIAVLPDEDILEVDELDEDKSLYLLGKIEHKSNIVYLLDVEEIISSLKVA